MSDELYVAIAQREQLCALLAKKTKQIDRTRLIAILTSTMPLDQLTRLVGNQNK
jgi:hypothetical protein